MIMPFLLDLLFENLIETFEDLEYEEIYFEYWDFDMAKDEPSLDLFGPVMGDETYMKKLGKLFKSYFRNQHEH